MAGPGSCDIDALTSRERKASKTVALPGATFVPPVQRQTSCLSLPNHLAFYAAHSCRNLNPNPNLNPVPSDVAAGVTRAETDLGR